MPTTTINGQTAQLSPYGGVAFGKQNYNRKLIQWNIPNAGIVEMYINPESLSIAERKIIKEARTKGGFVIQYWGENLLDIDIAGTTGSGGIEGINVLHDIYRQEQIGFGNMITQLNSGFVSNLSNTLINAIQGLSSVSINTSSASSFLNSVGSIVGNVSNTLNQIGNAIGSDQLLLPTLAALATGLEMWYDGKTYRGYMTEMRVDEKAANMGLFNYTIKFRATRQSGLRLNGFVHQRSVSFGPANTDTIPLTFGGLITGGSQQAISTTTAAPTPASNISRRNTLTGG